MIESITIQNFLSIKGEQTLSFVASNKEKGSNNHLSSNWYKEIDDTKKILKLLILVGNNGAGKTNILQAIRYIKEIVTEKRDNRSEEIQYLPFEFDDYSNTEPTTMRITYYIGHECYQYSFKTSSINIEEEELKLIVGKKSTRVFYRTIKEKTGLTVITFGPACDLDKAAQKDLQAETISNTSVLSAFWGRNMESVVMRKNYLYFENQLSIVHRSKELTVADKLFNYESEGDGKMRELFKQLMKDLGSNIIDYKAIETSLDFNKEASESMPDPVREIFMKRYPDGVIKTRTLSFIHSTANGDYELPDGMESDGTMEIIKLMIAIYDIVLGRKSSFVDEVERGIHSKALNYIIQMFLALSEESQLVVASQDLTLVDMESLRRDSVRWIKKNNMGESFIEKINQNQIHKNKNLRNYLYHEMVNVVCKVMEDEVPYESYINILKKK